jgi:hypothetical protein
MSQWENSTARAGTVTRADGVIDEGLRSYMLGVYNYMASGVLLTGLVAYAFTFLTTTTDPTQAVATLKNGVMLTEFGRTIYGTPLNYVLMLAPLAFVFYLSFQVYKMSAASAQIAFWLFAGVMGLSLSSIFLTFTGESITQIFFITAAAFAGLSLYGYTTKSDLSGWGTFLVMGVIGIVIAAIVNLFLQSDALRFAISVIGVLVFSGLTAYDTQQIKDGYYEVRGNAELAAKSAIMGALALYLDFINLFTSLLSLFGSRE